MPLYEYECLEKGHRFELIRKFSDPPVQICVRCKSKVRRLLSAPAISFKGKGWYVTDYARGGNGDGGPGEKAKPDSGGDVKGAAPGSGGSSSAKKGAG